MKNIFLEETDDGPQLNFNFNDGVFEVKGTSMPEHPDEYYREVLTHLQIYVDDPTASKTTMVFKFLYFNTGTNPIIMRLLETLEKLMDKSHKVEVQWVYEHDDMDMKEVGEYFNALTQLDIKLFPIESID
ncbi:DUF1987 domain-containing protein [Microscilla marina]|uniref:SiaC family regulatory phosphoprotein domain-containing protein n=1 Tax=Microscilla marina ATCC 23134 TaxID=313606 RepID=A1ZQ28_MICM2|nr:DUF1987 domain-containing protein [Microscilla marina]EAY27437.1 conserved hypothetical protein [Microscilla marina ATCC 23134]